MSTLVLPEHLAVLIQGRPYIDVVGAGHPWPIPPGWWDHARRRVRALVNDRRAGATQRWTNWPERTRDAAPFLQNLAMSLSGHVAIFAGEFAQFPELIVDDFLAAGQRRQALLARNWYLTDSEWPLFLFRYAGADPTARRGSIELSRDCVAFLAEVGPLARRGTALMGVYDRVLTEPDLVDHHVHASYAEVAKLWRHSLLTEEERGILPEIAGWGAALNWSLEGLQAAHQHLAEVTTRAETLAEVVASMALTDHLDSLPAGLAVAAGADRFNEITTAFEQRRPTFDGAEWLQQNRAWLARGMLAGEIETCRSWLAMAVQVSRLVAGLPGPPRPSAAPDTIGFVTDVEELFTTRRGTNPLVSSLARREASPQDGDEDDTAELGRLRVLSGGRHSQDPRPGHREPDPEPPAVVIGDPQAELARLVGLRSVKEQVRRLVAEARADRLRQEAGMPATDRFRHVVFIGNPGTAKTTVARLLGRTYAQLGVLSNGHVIEATGMDLVGQYPGQTAPKVRRAFDRAAGGVLLIDEASSLVPPDSAWDFGEEAVVTLLQLMEDRRNDVAVVLSGAPGPMRRFAGSHPALASRFSKTLTFEDYTDDELFEIFARVAAHHGFVLGKGVEDAVRSLFPAPRPTAFGNGRFVRNLFEEAVSIQSERIVRLEQPEADEIRSLLAVDLPVEVTHLDSPLQGMYL